MRVLCITTCGDARFSLRALALMKTTAYTYLLDRYQAAYQFLERNNLLSIIRAHEAQDAGSVHTSFLADHLPNPLLGTGCIARPRRPASLRS
jgi:hypothetical protein